MTGVVDDVVVCYGDVVVMTSSGGTGALCVGVDGGVVGGGCVDVFVGAGCGGVCVSDSGVAVAGGVASTLRAPTAIPTLPTSAMHTT